MCGVLYTIGGVTANTIGVWRMHLSINTRPVT